MDRSVPSEIAARNGIYVSEVDTGSGTHESTDAATADTQASDVKPEEDTKGDHNGAACLLAPFTLLVILFSAVVTAF